MAYIKGKNVPGTEISEVGCRDKTDPVKIEKYILPYEMYFAGHSKRWNKQGVGFVSKDASSEYVTYGKRYLISREQFIDVVCQENNISNEDFDEYSLPVFSGKDDYILFPKRMYGRVMCVGIEEGIPILTFTSVKESVETSVEPSVEYLNMIALGIYETHNINKKEIVNYFSRLYGVKGNYTKAFLHENISSIPE